ncbi:MAG: DUF1854 domain-containing protein [Gemmatimonadaceae bacterium]
MTAERGELPLDAGPQPAAFRHPPTQEDTNMDLLGTKDLHAVHAPAAAPAFVLRRGVDGRLLVITDGARTPVRLRQLFPWSEPRKHLSLRDDEDSEVALVNDPNELDPESRQALEDALAEAGFVLEVTRVLDIDEEVEIRHWTVETKQGKRTFQTHLDDWPRVLPSGGRLIRDVGGDLYLLADPKRMDKQSRDLLWAFVD